MYGNKGISEFTGANKENAEGLKDLREISVKEKSIRADKLFTSASELVKKNTIKYRFENNEEGTKTYRNNNSGTIYHKRSKKETGQGDGDNLGSNRQSSTILESSTNYFNLSDSGKAKSTHKVPLGNGFGCCFKPKLCTKKDEDELQILLIKAQKEIWNNSSHNPLGRQNPKSISALMEGTRSKKCIPRGKSEILLSTSFQEPATHNNSLLFKQRSNSSSVPSLDEIDKLRGDLGKWRQFGYLLAESFDEIKQEQKVLLGERAKDAKVIEALKEQNNKLKALIGHSNTENQRLRDELSSEQRVRENIIKLKDNIDLLNVKIEEIEGEKLKLSKYITGMNREKESLVNENELNSKIIQQLNMKMKVYIYIVYNNI